MQVALGEYAPPITERCVATSVRLRSRSVQAEGRPGDGAGRNDEHLVRPAAPLGEMDYVVNGVMIGGFGLVAAPAEYSVTGVKTFMVSQDGVVYQKDLGPASLEEFMKMERFNPDKSWTPVLQEQE